VTALYEASRFGQLEICKELIQHGAITSWTPWIIGNAVTKNALHYAATNNDVGLVRVLLTRNNLLPKYTEYNSSDCSEIDAQDLEVSSQTFNRLA
jgi:ankyrin repeat protein